MNNSASAPAKITKATVLKNAHIENICLRVEKHNLILERYLKLSTKTQKWVQAIKIIEDRVEYLCFPLAPVSVEELELFRKAKIPSFVYKQGNELYYAEIPKWLNLSTALDPNKLGTHQCATDTYHLCNRLHSLSDEEGGCAMVRNHHFNRPERCPFVAKSIETFSVKDNCCLILSCQNYKPSTDDTDD